jgi:hypothetical protein
MLVRPVHKTTPGPRSIGHNLTCFRILPCRTSDAPGPRDGEAPERDRARTVSPTPPALSSSTARFKNPAGGDGFYNIFQERGIVVGWLAVGGMQRWMHRRRAEACGNLSNQANGGQRKIKIVLILSKNLKTTHLIFADVSLVRLKLRYSFPTLKYSLKKLVYKKDFCSLCSDLHKDLMGGSPGYKNYRVF